MGRSLVTTGRMVMMRSIGCKCRSFSAPKAKSGGLLTGFFPGVDRYRQPPSGYSRVYPVAQSRTDGFHGQESVGTGPVVLKVDLVTSVAYTGNPMDQFMCVPIFPRPLLD